MYSAPYPTHRGYQHGYAYEEHEYPEYAPQGGPTRTYGPPVQQQPQPASNPFLPATAQPTPAVSNSQKRNSRKKRQVALMSATPVVPQPLGNVAPTPVVLPTVSPNPTSTQQLAPPGKKWVLIEDSQILCPNHVAVQPAVPEIVTPEPELVKPNAELKAAQASVNLMQYIIESSLICLLEQRQRHPISKIGILEAFVPQQKIEVLSGVTTLGSVVISGVEYLKIHGLPSYSSEQLLGSCKFLKFNDEGMLHNFTDLAKLSAKAQEEKLENYKLQSRVP